MSPASLQFIDEHGIINSIKTKEELIAKKKKDQRGAANGLSMTVMSLFKSVAPAGAGIV